MGIMEAISFLHVTNYLYTAIVPSSIPDGDRKDGNKQKRRSAVTPLDLHQRSWSAAIRS
jgi:hypothetical protein